MCRGRIKSLVRSFFKVAKAFDYSLDEIREIVLSSLKHSFVNEEAKKRIGVKLLS